MLSKERHELWTVIPHFRHWGADNLNEFTQWSSIKTFYLHLSQSEFSAISSQFLR